MTKRNRSEQGFADVMTDLFGSRVKGEVVTDFLLQPMPECDVCGGPGTVVDDGTTLCSMHVKETKTEGTN